MTHPIRSIPHQKVSNPRRDTYNQILKNLTEYYNDAEMANASVALKHGATYAELANARKFPITPDACGNRYRHLFNKKASVSTPALSGKETYAVSNPSK